MPARHLILLSRKLVDLAAGRIKRLIVEMPPRHGKSEMISHWFPVWFLNQWLDKRIILTSYEADFASSWGRRVRNSISENEDFLRVRVVNDLSAANRWDTTAGGGMTTAGTGGPITGKGADLLIVDDPVKNQEEAFSETYREKAWEWWRSTAYTRLEPGGVAVIVMTRWHMDDLAGRIITEMQSGGEKWEVLCLPAIALEDDEIGRFSGEALWPARYDLKALAEIQQAVGSRVWQSLYQQSPVLGEGAMFRREWFKIVDQAYGNEIPFRYWDLAATEETPKSDPDWTVGAKVSTLAGQYFIQDIRRMRGTPKAVEDLIKQTAEVDSNLVQVWLEQEPGSSGVNTIDHYQRTVLPGFAVYGNKTTGSKILRAQPFSAAAEAGNVMLVKGPWIKEFLDECEAFPAGKHDDQVDAVSGAITALNLNPPAWEVPYQTEGQIIPGDRRDLSGFAMIKKEKQPWDM